MNANQLRDHVRESLPFYMVPQHFVELGAMPQTNNGKIDYKALPAPAVDVPQEDSSDDVAMPTTPAEKFLAGAWEDVLEIDDIALNDLFFDVGGHSLLVMKVIATVQEHAGIKLGPQDFLVATLEQMADKISEAHCFRCDQAKVESDSPTADEKTATNKTETTETVATSAVSDTLAEAEETNSQSQDVFRKLTGFWN